MAIAARPLSPCAWNCLVFGDPAEEEAGAGVDGRVGLKASSAALDTPGRDTGNDRSLSIVAVQRATAVSVAGSDARGVQADLAGSNSRSSDWCHTGVALVRADDLDASLLQYVGQNV